MLYVPKLINGKLYGRLACYITVIYSAENDDWHFAEWISLLFGRYRIACTRLFTFCVSSTKRNNTKELTISRFALVSGRLMCVRWGCSRVIRVEHTLWSGQIWRMTFKTPYCLSVRSLVLVLRPSRWLNAPQCGCQSPACQTCEDEAGVFILADETKQKPKDANKKRGERWRGESHKTERKCIIETVRNHERP